MIETGLATHYMESMGKLATLERTLSELRPYYQQGILDTPIQPYRGAFHEYTPPSTHRTTGGGEVEDINAEFRNVAIANILYATCTYDASGYELGNSWMDEQNFYKKNSSMYPFDPSLNFGSDKEQLLHQDRTSLLRDLAATLDSTIQQESSVQGIMERFQQIISDSSSQQEEEEKQCQMLVQGLLNTMQQSSPLALRAIYRLLQVGKDEAETWDSCIQREASVQRNLLQHSDFQTQKWKHASVADVTDDEVEELL